MNRTHLLGFGLALLIVAGALLMAQRTEPAASAADPAPGDTEPAATMAQTAPAPDAAPATDEAGNPIVQVWKSATCGCCTQWIEHLEAAGFVVEAQDVANPTAIKDRYGIPASVRSCHTALVDGYLIEGHVPHEDVRRLLEERPQVAGIGVPGMPIGSPGMEVGDQQEPYDVLTFTGDGSTSVYSSH